MITNDDLTNIANLAASIVEDGDLGLTMEQNKTVKLHSSGLTDSRANRYFLSHKRVPGTTRYYFYVNFRPQHKDQYVICAWESPSTTRFGLKAELENIAKAKDPFRK